MILDVLGFAPFYSYSLFFLRTFHIIFYTATQNETKKKSTLHFVQLKLINILTDSPLCLYCIKIIIIREKKKQIARNTDMLIISQKKRKT